MAEFSKTSLARLETCDQKIQVVCHEVVRVFDCTVLEGHRGQEAQHKAFLEGASKVDWPNGPHNKFPSRAVDIMPYPIDWKDIPRLCYFAGFMMSTALMMGIYLRWGKDWDGDRDLNDQTFNDGPHYELIG